MPIMQITMNVALDSYQKEGLLSAMTDLIGHAMEKPVQDIMVIYDFRDLFFASSSQPAAFIDFRLITGFQIAKAKKLCEGINRHLNRIASVDPARVYINFFETSELHAWRFINGEAVCPASKN